MATSNNPRKFSEKIALHNQKQAEETAAFEEVMKDLSITRAARVSLSVFSLVTAFISSPTCGAEFMLIRHARNPPVWT